MHSNIPVGFKPIFWDGANFGGYVTFILSYVLTMLGRGGFTVYSGPRPSTQEDVISIAEFATSSTYAYVDDNKVIVVFFDGAPGWLKALVPAGFQIRQGAKVVKRLKTLNRPAPLWARFSGLTAREVDITHFIDRREVDEYMEYDADQRKMPADGIIVMPERLRQEMFEQAWTGWLGELDAMRQKAWLRRMSAKGLYNVRIIWAGGFAKGNGAFIPDHVFTKLYGNVDFALMAGEIKDVVSLSKGAIILADPQPGHFRVRVDIQSLINRQHDVFQPHMVAQWITDFAAITLDKVSKGEALKGAGEMLNLQAKAVKDHEANRRYVYNDVAWNALEAVASGLDLRMFPDMLRTVSNAEWAALYNFKAVNLEDPSEPLPDMHVPVPNSWYGQIISAMAARMCGVGMFVEPGDLVGCDQLGVAVINDLDYIESYEDHGGPDMDDHFKCVFRGQEVYTWRSPNSWGEMVVRRVPKGHLFLGRDMSTFAPVPPATPDGRHITRLSDALSLGADVMAANPGATPDQLWDILKEVGGVVYTGLPSTKVSQAKSDVDYGEYYSQQYFRDSLQKAFELEGGAGFVLNAMMIWTSVFKMHRPVQLCNMETVLDSYTQDDAPVEDIRALEAYARSLIMEVVESGLPIDERLWINRKGYGYLSREMRARKLNFTRGWYSQLHDHIQATRAQYFRDLEAMLAEQVVIPTSMVEIADRMLGEWGGVSGAGWDGWGAARIFRNYRDRVAATMNDLKDPVTGELGEVDARYWRAIDNGTFREFLRPRDVATVYVNRNTPPAARERLQRDRTHKTFGEWYGVPSDQRDMAIAMLVAAHMYPTRGKVKERYVTAEKMWPKLLDALRYYGYAHEIGEDFVDEHVLVCAHCGLEHTTTDKVAIQRYDMNGHLCRDCRNSFPLHEACVECGKEGDIPNLESYKLFVEHGMRCRTHKVEGLLYWMWDPTS